MLAIASARQPLVDSAADHRRISPLATFALRHNPPMLDVYFYEAFAEEAERAPPAAARAHRRRLHRPDDPGSRPRGAARAAASRSARSRRFRSMGAAPRRHPLPQHRLRPPRRLRRRRGPADPARLPAALLPPRRRRAGDAAVDGAAATPAAAGAPVPRVPPRRPHRRRVPGPHARRRRRRQHRPRSLPHRPRPRHARRSASIASRGTPTSSTCRSTTRSPRPT